MQKCLHLIDFTRSESSRNAVRMFGLIEDEWIFRKKALKESECPKVRKWWAWLGVYWEIHEESIHEEWECVKTWLLDFSGETRWLIRKDRITLWSLNSFSIETNVYNAQTKVCAPLNITPVCLLLNRRTWKNPTNAHRNSTQKVNPRIKPSTVLLWAVTCLDQIIHLTTNHTEPLASKPLQLSHDVQPGPIWNNIIR